MRRSTDAGSTKLTQKKNLCNDAPKWFYTNELGIGDQKTKRANGGTRCLMEIQTLLAPTAAGLQAVQVACGAQLGWSWAHIRRALPDKSFRNSTMDFTENSGTTVVTNAAEFCWGSIFF